MGSATTELREGAPIASGRRRLRVTVQLSAWWQPAWICGAVELMAAEHDLSLVVAPPDHAEPAPDTRREKLSTPLSRWFHRFDRRILLDPDAFQLVDLQPLAERLGLTPTPADAGPVADVVVDFTGEAGVADAVRPRAGIWRVQVGAIGLEPAGTWEVLAGNPITRSTIAVRETARSPERLCWPTYLGTDPVSVRRSRNGAHWKAGLHLAHALRACADELPAPVVEPDRVVPGAAALDRRVLGWSGRYAGVKWRERSAREQWCLAYHLDAAAGGSAGGSPHGVIADYTTLAPPPDRLWADPFPVGAGSDHLVFFEEQRFDSPRAHIAVADIDAAGRVFPGRPVLERPYHLSYPFVFSYQGTHFMIPETADNRTIELYRASRFPDEWTLERVMLRDIFAVDATLWQEGARWWLFAGVGIPGAEVWDDLCIFTSDSPLGEWQPHPRNPVKSDVRCSRPAGNLFVQDGALYRPAQICVPRYGYGIALQRVDRLDQTGYAESEVTRLLPDPRRGMIGVHTMNRTGRLSVIDWQRHLRRPLREIVRPGTA